MLNTANKNPCPDRALIPLEKMIKLKNDRGSGGKARKGRLAVPEDEGV